MRCKRCNGKILMQTKGRLGCINCGREHTTSGELVVPKLTPPKLGAAVGLRPRFHGGERQQKLPEF